MLAVILVLIIGAVVVYISQYNFMPVSVNLGFHVFSHIPLFYVIVGSLLIGLILSYGVYLVHVISSSFALRGKDNEIKKNRKEILELNKKIRQLEVENEKLKRYSVAQPPDKETVS